MKKRILYLYLLVVLLQICLPGCEEDKHYRIGISQCSQDDWRAKMNDEIYREIMFHPEVEVEIRSADDNNAKQISDIRYFRNNGFDIIIAAPNEADAITPIIKEVYEGGTPVIVFDRNIHGDTYTATMGVDNYGIGQAAAQYARNLIGRGGKVIEIYGLGGSTPAIDRHNGFNDEARELGLEIVGCGYGNWNQDDAARVADTLLTAHPDAQLIYAHNDRMAIAASEKAREKGLDLKVIGIDAAPEIGIQAVADGTIDATFLYPTEGYGLIRMALAILEGKPYERETRLPVAPAVDKTNAGILLLQNESLKEETAKIKLLKSQVDEYWDRHSAQTTLFYAAIVIVVLLFGLLFMVLRTFWIHKRHQAELVEQNRQLAEQRDTEKKLNKQLEEATQSKLMFFTNVSHDLRTPLALISEPIEQLLLADYLQPKHRSLMKIADKNAKVLKNMLNQILDFRKFENGMLGVNLTEVHIKELLNDWVESFKWLARRHDIKLVVEIEIDDTETLAIDVEKIRRVFYNLVSNAFKFTPDNGRIIIKASIKDKNLVIIVDDNGEGIPADDIKLIFERFYQADKVRPKGSGIGLAVAKAFVDMHGGKIDVKSIEGSGSQFTVSIPVTHIEYTESDEQNTIDNIDIDLNAELEEIELDTECGGSSSKPVVLIIEDNVDIRRIVKELLSDEYRVIEARNGKVGVQKATKFVPDLILCDVMMPVMDGLECCRLIKDEMITSHIPILMLTACSMEEQQMQSYESGADGHLSKPFSGEMLRMRCKNLIENRKRLKNLTIYRNVPEPPSDMQATSGVIADMDNEFYNRFVDVVTEEIGNMELSVDMIASRMGLGRSQFYRKLKSLTNYSPVELLRKMRLEKARQLLGSTEMTISEIAYEVGFSTPTYFAKVFRDTYGETPKEMRARLGY